MRRTITASLLLSTAFAGTASAQEVSPIALDEDEDVIIVTGEVSTFGATKSETPIIETARSVSVISAEDWRERGALTLDDTLNYTAGVVGDTFGFSTRGDFPRVRGLDVPEYLDNIQVLFGFYNNARSDIFTLEQVEVLKGPASVLYGQGSPGGILNTVSKRAGPDAIGSEFYVEYGTFDRTQVSADIGADLSGDGTLTARLVTLFRDADTQVDFVNDDAFILAPSITYDDGRTVATLLASYTDRESDTAHQFLPLAVTACASDEVTVSEPNICSGNIGQEVDASLYVGDPAFNRYGSESFSLTGFFQHRFSDALGFEATARYRDNSADYRQTWVSFLGSGNPRVLADGTAAGRSWYDAPAGSDQFAVDGRLRARFDTGPIEHEVLAGINYQSVDTLTEASFLYALPTTFNLLNPIYDGLEIPAEAAFDAVRGRSINEIDSVGYYINNQMTLGDLVLNAGVRFDDLETGNGTTNQDDSATSLSFGALYKTSIGLNPYASYAESFQAVVGNDMVTNQPLLPQEGKQIEVGLKYQPPGTRTYVTMAYFDIEQSNLPNPAGLPNAPSQQEGIAKIDGFEIEAQTAIGDLTLDAAFSVIDTQDPDGARFPSVPEVQGSAWASWRPSSGSLKGLALGAGVRFAGGNESSGTAFIAANGFAPTPVLIETDGYTVFDGLIGYSFDRYSLTLNGRNIFDTEYYGTCLSRGDCFPGEGRTIQLRAGVRF
ncbi:TonB-dependent siderophore receptor [Erythrobacter sp.]|uniref:TonB-dependent siderophore receptor n=1 Tax=Erythrobacter sp. TaxID=1042 RepID=UPI001B015BDD|nr:TonB-dependent siderophore receptor [Erythrobacter sp.]MBO6526941.1 TonB-dependent siderophore receptor [Erythrobacter sp.]MBO6528613.1 TonB-dependent siderophore receptor [Erythrobacter sp.]